MQGKPTPMERGAAGTRTRIGAGLARHRATESRLAGHSQSSWSNTDAGGTGRRYQRTEHGVL